MKKIIKNCLLYLFVVLILLNVLLFKESRAIKGLIFISSIVAFLTSIPCVFCVNKLLKIEIKNNILRLINNHDAIHYQSDTNIERYSFNNFSLYFSILAMAKVRAATDWAFRASSSKVAGISLATTLHT